MPKQWIAVTKTTEAAAMKLAGYDVVKECDGSYRVDYDGRIVLEHYRAHVRDLA